MPYVDACMSLLPQMEQSWWNWNMPSGRMPTSEGWRASGRIVYKV